MEGQKGTWFTEVWAGEGSAISLEVSAKLEDRQSAFQRIEVYETTRFGRLLTLDGLVMCTTRDNFLYHEMLSHPALYGHPAPRDVLIIGGGDCGTLQQVLRHPTVQRVTQVEIDAAVTEVCAVHFAELCRDNDDPRATLVFEDGIAWVEAAAAGSYDVILVDGSDPLGPAAVLFSPEFYRACYRALRDGGVLAGQSESPLFHMELLTHVHRIAGDAGFSDSRTLFFPQCVYPSGWWSATLCSKGGDVVVPGPERYQGMGAMRYFSPAIHAAAFAPPAFFAEAIPSALRPRADGGRSAVAR